MGRTRKFTAQLLITTLIFVFCLTALPVQSQTVEVEMGASQATEIGGVQIIEVTNEVQGAQGLAAAATLELSLPVWVVPTIFDTSRPDHIDVNVTSNTTWGISVAAEDESWFRVVNVTPANRTGNGSFRVEALRRNSTTTARNGTLTVTGGGVTRTFTVVHPPAPPLVSLSPSGTREMPQFGGSFTMNISVPNPEMTWHAYTNIQSWLTISNITPTNQTGSGSLRVNVAPNTSLSDRTASIFVSVSGSPQRLEVRQPGLIPPTLSTTSWDPLATGESIPITLTTNTIWSVASSHPSWLIIESIWPSNRTGDGLFTIRAMPNTGSLPRTGTITVSGGGRTATIQVSQATNQPFVRLTRPVGIDLAAGGNFDIPVAANTTWNIPTSSNPSWLTVTHVPNNRSGDGSFTVRVEPNTTDNTREARINVSSATAPTATLFVTQRPILALSGTELLTVPSSGLDIRDRHFVSITSDPSVTWSVASDRNWIWVQNVFRAPLTNNGSFEIEVSRNNEGRLRQGWVTATGTTDTGLVVTRRIQVSQSP